MSSQAAPLSPSADTARETSKQHFLQAAGWGAAERALLAGDASFRKYDRVRRDGVSAVLMDAPPPVEDVRPFIHVARWLKEAGFSAPEILAEDAEGGWLLLEDLGDDSYTKLLTQAPQREGELYREAASLLAALHASPHPLPEALTPYDAEKLQQEADLLVNWYLRAVRGPEAARAAMPEWRRLWGQVFAALPPLPPVVVLRDYHADNLMWLESRQGAQRVGLLDFQDALIGSPAYDLVSFLEDARRDVRPETVRSAIAAYAKHSDTDEAKLRLHYAALGAQRNAKILGIFLRLTLRDNKPHYLRFLPRVWNHFRQDITHPSLSGIAEWTTRWLPPETQTLPDLATLRRTHAEDGGA